METIDDTDPENKSEKRPPATFKRTSWTAQKAIALRAALEVGASIRVACAAAGISNKTYYNWRKDVPGFADMVDIARGKSKLAFVETVWNATNGATCNLCEFGVLVDPETDKVRPCSLCDGTGKVWSPASAGKLALSVLERTTPEDYGKTDTVNHTVDSRVQLAAHVQQHVQLEHVPAEQLASIAWGLPPAQIEAADLEVEE